MNIYTRIISEEMSLSLKDALKVQDEIERLSLLDFSESTRKQILQASKRAYLNLKHRSKI